MGKMEYDSWLEELQNICRNYQLDLIGDVFDNENKIQTDENICLKTSMYFAYCNAYKYYIYEMERPLKADDNAIYTRALYDYGIFNSFISNCVIEYRMYNHIGTGKISYYPYYDIADFFFKEFSKVKILEEYIKNKLLENNVKKQIKR